MKRFVSLLVVAVMLFAMLTFAAISASAETVYTIYAGQTINVSAPCYVEFTPTVSGTYSFYSNSSNDTKCYLYDEDSNQLTYDDDDGDGYNFMIEYDLTAGNTYSYRCVFYSGGSGSYSVTLDLISEFNENVSPDGLSIYDIALDEDLYVYAPCYVRFTPSVTGTYTFQSDSSSDTRGYLYDSSWSQLDSDDDDGDGSNFMIEYSLTANQTYYYKCAFYGGGSGSYYVSLSLIGSPNSTYTITAGETKNVYAPCYVQFTPSVTGIYSFQSSGSYDTKAYLYDSNGNQLDSDDDDGDSSNFMIEHGLEAGKTYTFECEFLDGSSGYYNVSLELLASVYIIKEGQTINIYAPGYVAFTPATTGVYRFQSSGSSDTDCYLYDSDLNEIAYNDQGGEGNNFLIEHTLTAGNTYYFYCKYYYSGNTGYFDVTLNLYQTSAPDGLSIEEIYLNDYIYIDAPCYVKFTPSVSGTYYFGSDEYSYDTKGYLYDSSWNYITEDDDSGSDSNFLISYNLQAGQTYYYKCTRYSGGELSYYVFLYDHNPNCSTDSYWSYDSYAHWKYCSCGSNHEYAAHTGSWVVIYEAGDTTSGYKEYRCVVCDCYMDSQEIPPLHDFSGDWQSNATSHWKACECGETHYNAPHNGYWVTTIEPDVDKQGKKEYICEDCNYVINTSILPPTHTTLEGWFSDYYGHWKMCSCGYETQWDWHYSGDWEVIAYATENCNGLMVRKCIDCGFITETQTLYSDHPFTSSWYSNYNGHWHICDCHGIIVDSGAHVESGWIVATQPDYYSEGKKEKRCIYCGAILASETIPKFTEHNYDEDIIIQAGNLGDINGNGKIDMTDYILVKRAYFGTFSFSPDQNTAGDINKNGKIDMTDYILLKRVYFGTYTLK